MMSMYCKTCGHHSSLHNFSVSTNEQGCTAISHFGDNYEKEYKCMCSGFKKKEYTFGDRIKRYAEQQIARQALYNERLKRGPRGIGHYWSGKKENNDCDEPL